MNVGVSFGGLMSCDLILDADDLADFRAMNEANLPDLCEIWSLKPEGTGPGTRNKGSAVFPSDWLVSSFLVPCSLKASLQRRTESQIGGQTRAKGDWIITFKWDQAISSLSRVKITTLENRVFNVIGRLDGSDAVKKQVEANEVS
jgi:hypothetical protein